MRPLNNSFNTLFSAYGNYLELRNLTIIDRDRYVLNRSKGAGAAVFIQAQHI
jgi:hypothetical protein